MGWFWSDSQTNSGAAAKCPVDHSKPAVCPIDHSKSSIAVCPVKPSDDDAVFNPMNNMPLSISSERAPGQKITLSTERTISSIPRGESEDLGSWEYPSPQQMLNAMLKKGKGEGVDEEAVTSMVDVHNFLNEGAWYQILEWEVKHTKETKVEPRLLKFTGRPHDLSPRAQMYLWLGNLFPERFNTQPPFDRHDWTVLRSRGRDQGWDQVRYVIDYYGAPDDEETGMPSPQQMLDTRPALDSPQSAVDRFTHWSQPLWKKAMGETEE